MSLNRDFDFDLEIDEDSQSTLKITNKGQTNREKVTADQLGRINWNSKLELVQYGTYDGRNAVLVVFRNRFNFIPQTARRVQSVSIEFEFEETEGPTFALPNPRDPNNDPQVVLLGPVEAWGEIAKVKNIQTWNIRAPLLYQNIGIEGSIGAESTIEKESRTWLHGYSQSTDDHDYDNRAKWDCVENAASQNGIFPEFTTVVVVLMPSTPIKPVKITAAVDPHIVFPHNVLHFRNKRDDPVFLDGSTPKGAAINLGKDFKDKDFPWEEVIHLPQENQVSLKGSLR